MSKANRLDPRQPGAEDDRSQGPNLKLIYSLIILAMLIALGIAAWIVMPFYLRR